MFFSFDLCVCERQRERKEGPSVCETEREKRMKIQSRVKYIKLMNIMIIQMNGAMRKINY